MSEVLLLEKRGGVATLTLNRPDKLNALSLELAHAFALATSEVEHDPAVRAVVLRGAGRGFMAGGDVAAFHANLDRIDDVVSEMIDAYHVAVRTLARMAKPVLASLHGAVAGAGVSLAVNADLAIAADNTVFALAYANLGTNPDGGSTYFLPRLVGRRKAMEMALLPDRLDAATALSLGLVNWVVPADRLEAETNRIAERLAAGPPLALGETNRLIAPAIENSLSPQLDAERDAFRRSAQTRDFRAGVTAFVEKRKPEFRGE